MSASSNDTIRKHSANISKKMRALVLLRTLQLIKSAWTLQRNFLRSLPLPVTFRNSRQLGAPITASDPMEVHQACFIRLR